MSHVSGIPQGRAGKGNWGRWLLRPFLIQRASCPCASLEICLHLHSPAGNKEESVIYNLFCLGCVPWPLKSNSKALPFIPHKREICAEVSITSVSYFQLTPSHSFSSSLSTAFPALQKHFKPFSSPYSECTAMPGLARVSSRKFQILHQMAERV